MIDSNTTRLTAEDFARLGLDGDEQPLIIGAEHRGSRIETQRDIVVRGDLGDLHLASLHSDKRIIIEPRTGLVIDGSITAASISGDKLPGECNEQGQEIVRHRFGISAATVSVAGNVSCGGDLVALNNVIARNVTVGGSLIAGTINASGWVSAQKGINI